MSKFYCDWIVTLCIYCGRRSLVRFGLVLCIHASCPFFRGVLSVQIWCQWYFLVHVLHASWWMYSSLGFQRITYQQLLTSDWQPSTFNGWSVINGVVFRVDYGMKYSGTFECWVVTLTFVESMHFTFSVVLVWIISSASSNVINRFDR